MSFFNQRKKGLFFMNACETKILAVITTRGTMGEAAGRCSAELWGLSGLNTASKLYEYSWFLHCQSCKQARVAVQKDGSREQATARRTQEAHCFYQLYFAHILWSLNIV